MEGRERQATGEAAIGISKKLRLGEQTKKQNKGEDRKGLEIDIGKKLPLMNGE